MPMTFGEWRLSCCTAGWLLATLFVCSHCKNLFTNWKYILRMPVWSDTHIIFYETPRTIMYRIPGKPIEVHLINYVTSTSVKNRFYEILIPPSSDRLDNFRALVFQPSRTLFLLFTHEFDLWRQSDAEANSERIMSHNRHVYMANYICQNLNAKSGQQVKENPAISRSGRLVYRPSEEKIFRELFISLGKPK